MAEQHIRPRERGRERERESRIERENIYTEDPEEGRKTPFPSEGGGVMTFLYG
jgi:hypothetical protein